MHMHVMCHICMYMHADGMVCFAYLADFGHSLICWFFGF